MSLQCIPCVESDRAFFIRAHHESFRFAIEKTFGEWNEAAQDQFASQHFNIEGNHVLWRGQERVGVVGWEDRENCLWLKNFYILPEFQGQGIGGQILKDCIKRAQSLRKEMELRTLKSNFKGKNFYEHHGFQIVEETDVYWKLAYKVPER